MRQKIAGAILDLSDYFGLWPLFIVVLFSWLVLIICQLGSISREIKELHKMLTEEEDTPDRE